MTREPIMREPVRRELFGGAPIPQGSTFKVFMDCKPPSKKVEDWFFSEGSKKEIALDFLALKEGSMLIAKYNITFIERHNLPLTTILLRIRWYEAMMMGYHLSIRS
ncbi:unnamed protein product [Lactuca saligna]|uniref:Uncharacterized protein n=1 Tax=Lactuca saligna TaxID=75948 RepID=A0AA35Z189_LACSI|nr:unnamed protein product [Lactuca saligna]